LKQNLLFAQEAQRTMKQTYVNAKSDYEFKLANCLALREVLQNLSEQLQFAASKTNQSLYAQDRSDKGKKLVYAIVA
jgi:hypothetical protein